MLLWLTILASVPALYLGFGALIFLFQGRIVFRPSSESLCDPGDAGLAFEDCRFKTKDGVELRGWFIPAEKPLCNVLLCAGNAGNMSYYLETALDFHETGCSLLLFNYRGYGPGGGPFPTEEGVCLDAEAAWDYLVKERGAAPESIAVVGRSLGGGVACELALRRNPKALVLESTFKSIPAMAAELYPLYPSKLLARVKFDNISKVPRVKCPTLVIHSPFDELIPYRHGKALFKASGGEPKSFLTLSGPHNECYFCAEGVYKAGLRSFLASCFAPQGEAKPDPNSKPKG